MHQVFFLSTWRWFSCGTLCLTLLFFFTENRLRAEKKGAENRMSTVDASEDLYSLKGEDPSFASLIKDKALPVGFNSKKGVTGSKIDVNNELVEAGLDGQGKVPKNIKIHTLGNSFILRQDFKKWTRWYQEDGNTQVFRLFEGEHNVRNGRKNAARIEAFSALKWTKGGDWHEWEGTYTIIKAHECAIFQSKNNKNDWGVMINLTDEGDVILNHRRGQEDVVIAKGVTRKPFTLKVRDNGHDYEVFMNNKNVGKGSYDRPEGQTAFRWGMYVGGKTLVKHEALLFVSGVVFK
jgi:hypothetical protein